MRMDSLRALGAGALLLASSASLELAVAQSPSFEPLRSTGGRFQIIGGSEAARERSPSPVALAAPRLPEPRAPAHAPAAATQAAIQTSPPNPAPAAAPAAAAAPPSVSTSEVSAAPGGDQTPATSPAPAGPAAPPPADLLAALEEPVAEPITTQADPILTAAVRPQPTPTTAVRLSAEENMKVVSSRNALMEEALRRARGSLEDFLKLAAQPPEGSRGFAVKVALGPREAREVLWLSELERRTQRNFLFGDSDRWSGKLANEPMQLNGLNIGDRVSFETSEIRDWTYVTADGRPLGNFSACALTAQNGRAKLAELVQSTGLDCSWLELAERTAAR